MRGMITFLLVFGALANARAFDTGYHHDLTGAVLREFGFESTPIRVVQAENWLVDYYSNSPTSPADVKAELVKLHCDNLFTTKEVTWYWSRLSENTIAAAKKAAAGNDPHKMLTILAMSLHAVQDFYSHSNWCDTHPRPADGFAAQTFLNSGAPVNQEIFTGFFDSMPGIPRPPGHPDHGGYDDGVNRDSQGKARWDDAFIFAYVAGWEWVAKLKSEVDAVDGTFWNKVKTFSLTGDDLAKLDFDEKAAYRISLWIKGAGGADGHWKGKLSGHIPSLAAITVPWTEADDSKSVQQIKVAKIQNQLTPNLYLGGVPPAIPTFPKFNLNRKVITLKFTQVKEVSNGLQMIDTLGKADFFTRVKIAGTQYVERVIQDDKSVDNPWWITAVVDGAAAEVPVRIDVLDEDSPPVDKEETCDINPTDGKKGLDFNLKLANAQMNGDVNGVHRDAAQAVTSKGESSDKNLAEVSFFADVAAIKNP